MHDMNTMKFQYVKIPYKPHYQQTNIKNKIRIQNINKIVFTPVLFRLLHATLLVFKFKRAATSLPGSIFC